MVLTDAGLVVRQCASTKKTETSIKTRPDEKRRLVIIVNMLAKTATAFCHDLMKSIEYVTRRNHSYIQGSNLKKVMICREEIEFKRRVI